jgi:hypothetical protein
MSYEVKFGFATGYNLVFTAFAEDGTGRGLAHQPLYEVHPTGYYRADSATSLVDGDVVLVYNNEAVYWEDVAVYCLTYAGVYWENDPVYWEGYEVLDYDSEIVDAVRCVGEVVGSGEYEFDTGEISSITESVADLVEGQSKVDVVFDERKTGEEKTTIAGAHL